MNPIYQAPILERLKDIERCVKLAIEYYEQDSPTVALDFRLREKENLKDDEIALFDWVIRPRFRDTVSFSKLTDTQLIMVALAELLDTCEAGSDELADELKKRIKEEKKTCQE